MRLFAFTLALLAMLGSGYGQAPRLSRWQIVGPGGGGTMIAPTISPRDSKLVFVHCDMTGGYISEDGGSSWRMFNLRGNVTMVALDPNHGDVVYAGSNTALWRSEDRGKSWSMIFPDPAKNTVEHQHADEAQYSLTSDDPAYPGGRLTAIAVSATNSDHLYAAFGQGRQGPAVYHSLDRGRSWQRLAALPEEALLLAPGPAGLQAVAGHAVYTISAGGQVTEGAALGSPIHAAGSGRAPAAQWFWATTQDGRLYVSENGGARWREATPSLGRQSGRFEAIAAAERHPEVAYVGFRGLQLGDGAHNRFNGIAKTSDGGRSWKIVFKESDHPAANLKASWIEQRATEDVANWRKLNVDEGDIWFDSPYSLGVAPNDPGLVYATDLFRAYRSSDGGATWQQVNSTQPAPDLWRSRGLDVTTNYGVQVDPFDSRHLYIDYTDIGLFQSWDGGSTWRSTSEGVPAQWRNTAYWLAFDPAVKGLMWGAFSGMHDLPRTKMWMKQDFNRARQGGVGLSVDGGLHWTPSNLGMPPGPVTHILLDPESPPGRRTLYATSFGTGVFKSVDNGKSWTLKNRGIQEENPYAWRIVRADSGTLYLVVARSNDGNYGRITGSGAIYASTDKAEHWSRINLPVGTNGPTGLAVDPRDERRLYLSAWGQNRPDADADTGGGVFLSTDGGQSWSQIFKDNQRIYDVTGDPRNPETFYLCGFGATAYRSDDRGHQWSPIRGFNFWWGHRIIPDPNDPAMIYVTTFGGGVWHGPAAGDPAAPEEILTPVPVAR